MGQPLGGRGRSRLTASEALSDGFFIGGEPLVDAVSHQGDIPPRRLTTGSSISKLWSLHVAWCIMAR
jgi:hypothetical protein